MASDAVDPVAGSHPSGPRAPNESVLSLPVTRLPLERLIEKWKERSDAANRKAEEQHGHNRDRALYCDGQSTMAKLCAIELAACLGAPREKDRLIALLEDVDAFLDTVEWNDTTSETDAANLQCEIQACLGAAVLPPSPQDKPEDLNTRMDRQPGLTASVPRPPTE